MADSSSPPPTSAELNGHGSFWAKAMKADTFILLDTVQFSPHSYMQRAKLRDGCWLTVPVQRPHIVPIKDLLIDWTHYDPRLHLDLIQEAGFRYWRRALEHVTYPPLHDPYPDKLADWNTRIIEELNRNLGIGTKFQRASEIEANHVVPNDAEYHLLLDLQLVGADTYLAGPSCRRYAPSLENILKEHGIALEEVK